MQLPPCKNVDCVHVAHFVGAVLLHCAHSAVAGTPLTHAVGGAGVVLTLSDTHTRLKSPWPLFLYPAGHVAMHTPLYRYCCL